MPEALDIDELRRGIDQIDLEHILGDYEPDINRIRNALDFDNVEEAKAVIADMLRAASESGFPVGAEIDLAKLVGFADND